MSWCGFPLPKCSFVTLLVSPLEHGMSAFDCRRSGVHGEEEVEPSDTHGNPNVPLLSLSVTVFYCFLSSRNYHCVYAESQQRYVLTICETVAV